MTGSSTSSQATVARRDLPAQRRHTERAAGEHARAGLVAVREATAHLQDVVARLGDLELRRPSLLPGWTKAHVVAHLARNADACLNALTWARTGVEHPMYASSADRDAAIEESARALPQVLREDLAAASARFEAAAEQLSDSDWQAELSHRTGRVFPALDLPAMRLFEVWVHLVDLDAGVTFDDVPDGHLDSLLDSAVRPHATRTGGQRVPVVAHLPDGGQRSWEVTIPAMASSAEIAGSGTAVLGWLTGRGTGSGLNIPAPALPDWG